MSFNVGILISSDTCFKDNSLDKTSHSIKECFSKYNKSLEGTDKYYSIKQFIIVPDNLDDIQKILTEWCKEENDLSLILTSGGTGYSKKDITPEAVKPLIHKEAIGIVHKMLSDSLKITPFAMMARPVAGVRNNTLIITLPGSPKGAVENLEAVLPTLAHALDQLGIDDSRALHKGIAKSHQREHSHSHHSHHHDNHGDSTHKQSCGISKHRLISNDLNGPITARSRSSPYPMISMDEAFNLISQNTPRPTVVSKNINNESITGYVLSENIYAPTDVPNFRASIVDGYAVVHTDGPGTYSVVSVSHASPTEEQHVLKSGEISRITTGAPIPQGATAIVMVEETQIVSMTDDGKEEKEVCILASDVKENDNVREKGSDIKKGELLLEKQSVISATGGEIGLLTSVGISNIKVFEKPLIGVLSTGDELVDIMNNNKSSELQYGQIYDCNRPVLLSVTRDNNFDAIDLGIASDKASSLENLIRNAFDNEKIDYLITSGGVSMGELDLLKPIIERRLNGEIHFGRVKMKPGKPTTFATLKFNNKIKVIFALPGNPASATVCFHLFVLPSLRLFSGYNFFEKSPKLPTLPTVRARLIHDVQLDPRPEYQRGFVKQTKTNEPGKFELVVENTGFQRSSRIASFKGANALIVLPSREQHAGNKLLEKGNLVNVILIGPFSSEN
ncbi:hypothetical protein PACTADRAFT_48588 [Pachysolen tannophilus NRRL Y-2460]|uniref:MoaB/Mog domain-containing protein n=1 Tax=Pachysolen tannophilus NRRL Y-2460 TaxID=669874 RepID=A0A1E4TYG9_PACTA|nr:hypothetical protein PACTADRAFT_48588 [Pachysolen tannophilus NRRL Y-2460]